ncbi:MAG: hypothetical protein HY673_19530 [Chloroflexi bacterium]|nr:hypothetical protein [Chloroflexota bacterium]
MPVVVNLDKEANAALDYIAAKLEKRKSDVAAHLLGAAILQKFSEMIGQTVAAPELPKEAPESSKPRKGRGGHKVTYGGPDRTFGPGRTLEHGKTYPSYKAVLDIVLPEKVQLLYTPLTHKGYNAEDLLKRYAPDVHKDLRPE